MDTPARDSGPRSPVIHRGKRMSLTRIIVVNLALVVILLLVLEAIVRVAVSTSTNPQLRVLVAEYSKLARGEPQRFMPAPYVNYRLTPGFRAGTTESGVTRHNLAGFRQSEETGPKEKGALRIICIGGSTTYGAAVHDNQWTYPAKLEGLLNGDLRPDGYERVEVINLGVGGYTSAEELAMLHFFGLPLEPDIVLIQSGLNDVAPRFYAEFEPSYSHFRKPMEALDKSRLARLCCRSYLFLVLGWKLGLIEPITLQARTQLPLPPPAEARENFGRNGPELFRRNLRATVALALASGARVWLLTQSYLGQPSFAPPDDASAQYETLYEEGVRQHNEVVRQLAAEMGVGLIDLASETKPDRRHFADPVHMSQAGNSVKAKLIAQALHAELAAGSHAGGVVK